MNKAKLNRIITLTIIVVILAIGLFVITKAFTPKINPNQNSTQCIDEIQKNFAKCVGEHSVLYIQDGCSHCYDQERLFGDNIQYLTSVSLNKDPEKFIEAGIKVTPTWIVDGLKFEGTRSLKEIGVITGCYQLENLTQCSQNGTTSNNN